MTGVSFLDKGKVRFAITGKNQPETITVYAVVMFKDTNPNAPGSLGPQLSMPTEIKLYLGKKNDCSGRVNFVGPYMNVRGGGAYNIIIPYDPK